MGAFFTIGFAFLISSKNISPSSRQKIGIGSMPRAIHILRSVSEVAGAVAFTSPSGYLSGATGALCELPYRVLSFNRNEICRIGSKNYLLFAV